MEKFKMEPKDGTCSQAEDDNLQLERGILTNVHTFSAVFKRIFLKYDREFDHDEDGGAMIDFATNKSFEKGITRLKNGTPDFFSSVQEVALDPEQTARLHERVVQVKKEINWSEDEQEENDIPIDPLVYHGQSSNEYENINSCSDTWDSDVEEDSLCAPPSPGAQRLLNSDKIPRPAFVKSPPLLEADTNSRNSGPTNSTGQTLNGRHSPALRIRKIPVHQHSCRATEPQADLSQSASPHYCHTQEGPPVRHAYDLCSCNFSLPMQYDYECVSCRALKPSVCMCPDCKDYLATLSDHSSQFYSPPSSSCVCAHCSEEQQSLMNSRVPLCQSCQVMRREKRHLEEYYDSPASPSASKRPCM